jgi:pantoate--beta-alanine ligase
MIPATVAFFGQKDLQQCRVIQRMVEDLNVPIRIEVCPTVRESDGLAMSSRNRYLNEAERSVAISLWRAIQQAQEMISNGERHVASIEQAMHQTLTAGRVTSIDYARLVDAYSLEPLDAVSTSTPTAVIIAVRVGSTRLIDNAIMEVL